MTLTSTIAPTRSLRRTPTLALAAATIALLVASRGADASGGGFAPFCPPDVTIESGGPTDPGATGEATCDHLPLGGPHGVPVFTDLVMPGTNPGECVIRRYWGCDDAPNPLPCIVTVTVNGDAFSVFENSWVITDDADGTVYGSVGIGGLALNATTVTNVSVPAGAAWTFTIFDSFGDGLCCLFGNGSFSVSQDGTTICDTTFSGFSASCSGSCPTPPGVCLQRITVTGIPALAITCPADVTVECNASTAPAATGTATASGGIDLAGGGPDLTFSDAVAAGACPQDVTITRTWSATDDCGATASCAQTITVLDTTNPVITCPADVTIACTASTAPANTGTATATDACSVMGAGVFGPPTNFPAGNGPACVTSGLFNGDSFLDLAVANANEDFVMIFLGDGMGGFGPAMNFPSGGISTSSVATGHFDDDAFLDLAVTHTFTANVSILLGDGLGGFFQGPSLLAGGISPNSVTTGLFNGDSFLDLAVANVGSDTVSIYLGDGTGGFGAAMTFPAGDVPISIATGLFDGDAFLDLAVANRLDDNVLIFLGDGMGGFTMATNVAVGVSPWSVATGLFDGDAFLDLAVANSVSHDVSILLGDGTGGFGTATSLLAGSAPWSVTVGLFDADDVLDLAVANSGSHDVSILPGDGAGGFGTAMNFPAGVTPNSIISGLFDGDAFLDLAVVNFNPSNVLILLNQATFSGTVTSNDVISDGSCPQEFTIERTWTATDECGNESMCVQTITVEDTTDPIITCPADMTIACNASTDPSSTGSATATDDCDDSPAITSSDAISAGPCPQAMTITRTWTATDACGNASSCVQTITVEDVTNPAITCPPDVTIECDESPLPSNTGTATATDNCDPMPVVTVVGYGDCLTTTCAYPETIVRTWTATDCSGNTSMCMQTITIVDTTPPAITCPADVTIECGGDTTSAATGVATGTDACSGVTITETDAFSAACGGTGTITRIWTATDACGNSVSCDQVITVMDTTEPLVTDCPADVEAPYPDQGTSTTLVAWHPPTVSDDCSEPVTLDYGITLGGHVGFELIVSAPEAPLPPGLHMITVLATDACGNVNSECSFSVFVGHVPTDCFGDPLDACYVDTNCQDCNANGICDLEELILQPALDADGNTVIDSCEVACCGAGPLRVLVMRYLGDDCAAAPAPPAELACTDDNPLAETIYIFASDDDDPYEPSAEVWFEGFVSINDVFTISSLNAGVSRLGSLTYIHLFDGAPTLSVLPVQTVEIDTDCGAPITAGDQFGASVVLDCFGEDKQLPCESCFGSGGRPAILTMQYTGEDCSASSNLQDPALSTCVDIDPLFDTVYIRSTPYANPYDAGPPNWFEGEVSIGEIYTIDAPAAGFSRLTSSTYIHVFFEAPTLGLEVLQTIRIDTSCGEPLFENDRFGSARLLGVIREDDLPASPLNGSEDCNGNGIDDEDETALVPETDCNGNCIPDVCELMPRALAGDPVNPDANGNGILDECEDTAPPCPGDSNGDGMVNIDDIVNVVLDFDTDGSANGGDLNGDGIVDIDDIVVAVLNFGACPNAGT